MIGGLPDGVLLCMGLILLVFGGEAVVQGSIKIAKDVLFLIKNRDQFKSISDNLIKERGDIGSA